MFICWSKRVRKCSSPRSCIYAPAQPRTCPYLFSTPLFSSQFRRPVWPTYALPELSPVGGVIRCSGNLLQLALSREVCARGKSGAIREDGDECDREAAWFHVLLGLGPAVACRSFVNRRALHVCARSAHCLDMGHVFFKFLCSFASQFSCSGSKPWL